MFSKTDLAEKNNGQEQSTNSGQSILILKS